MALTDSCFKKRGKGKCYFLTTKSAKVFCTNFFIFSSYIIYSYKILFFNFRLVSKPFFYLDYFLRQFTCSSYGTEFVFQDLSMLSFFFHSLSSMLIKDSLSRGWESPLDIGNILYVKSNRVQKPHNEWISINSNLLLRLLTIFWRSHLWVKPH